jgi:hypothetical protein
MDYILIIEFVKYKCGSTARAKSKPTINLVIKSLSSAVSRSGMGYHE